MNTAAAHLPAILARVVSLAKLRAVALEHFEAGHGRFTRTRAGSVADVVSADMGLTNSPAFRAELRHALTSLGWREVRVENVALWVGVRAK